MYAIHVDLDKNTREFQNDGKENILYNVKNQENGMFRLEYRILYNNHKLPSIDASIDCTYTCTLDIDGWLADISIFPQGSYAYKYDNTYIFKSRYNNSHIVVTVYKKKIIILNMQNHLLTILDTENVSSKQYHMSDIWYPGNKEYIEEYSVQMRDGEGYRFKYDKFGNVDQVTKNNQIYSARDVVYTTKSKKSRIITTTSPLLFIIDKGIQIPDKGRIYYENTTCTIRNDKIVDVVREVYETSEEEYEKMIKQLIDADDCNNCT